MFGLLIGAAALHAAFMLFELLPWGNPILLRIVAKKLPTNEKFTRQQTALVATIVHNAGIYNAILAGGLLWSALAGEQGSMVAQVLLIGAAVAGVFGTATLKSPVTAIQAIVGVVGFFIVHNAK